MVILELVELVGLRLEKIRMFHIDPAMDDELPRALGNREDRHHTNVGRVRAAVAGYHEGLIGLASFNTSD